jgi:hypothetical protein
MKTLIVLLLCHLAAFAQPVLSISLTESNKLLTIVGNTNHAYTIEATQSVTGPWLTISTNDTDSTGTATFLDNTTDLTRFYRARSFALTDDLLVYFKLDEVTGTRYDTTTNKQLVEDPPSVDSMPGVIGNCAIGNVTRLLSTIADTNYTFCARKRSMSLWVKVDFGSDDLVIGRWEGSPAYSQWRLTTGSGCYEVQARDTNDLYHLQSATNVDTNWHHLVITYDSTNVLSLWVDGVKEAETFLVIQPVITRFTMLCDENNLLPFFGSVDEFGVWDRVLTEYEIVRLYNSGAGQRP